MCRAHEERRFAAQVTRVFGHMVCGFDLLRANGVSYVCDVNGWAAVKHSPEYWDAAALEMARLLRRRFNEKREL